jgi:putative sterol carrier protein
MAQAVVYLSEAWRSEAEKRLREALSPERMNRLTSSMTNVYKKCPDGRERFLFLRFEEGRLAESAAGAGAAPPAEFVISGDYAVFARITRAELASHMALMTGKLKLKGNMVKALKLASLADRINKVLATIETAYEQPVERS